MATTRCLELIITNVIPWTEDRSSIEKYRLMLYRKHQTKPKWTRINEALIDSSNISIGSRDFLWLTLPLNKNHSGILKLPFKNKDYELLFYSIVDEKIHARNLTPELIDSHLVLSSTSGTTEVVMRRSNDTTLFHTVLSHQNMPLIRLREFIKHQDAEEYSISLDKKGNISSTIFFTRSPPISTFAPITFEPIDQTLLENKMLFYFAEIMPTPLIYMILDYQKSYREIIHPNPETGAYDIHIPKRSPLPEREMKKIDDLLTGPAEVKDSTIRAALADLKTQLDADVDLIHSVADIVEEVRKKHPAVQVPNRQEIKELTTGKGPRLFKSRDYAAARDVLDLLSLDSNPRRGVVSFRDS